MNTTLSLNGLWDFVADQDPKYHLARNYAAPSWDRSRWLKVPVPGVWNKYAERYDLYEGVAWFAREFNVPALAAGATALLRFEGVNYLADIYLNGKLAGTHEGGYTEFALDVSALLRAGRNTVTVRVDNRAQTIKLPPVLGYYNYGGIHRDVSLELYPGPYLADIRAVAVPVAGLGQLQVTGRLAGAAAADCRLTITCAGRRAEVTPDADGRFTAHLEVPKVQAWTPDQPALYPVRLELSAGGQPSYVKEFQTGFRAFSVQGNQVLLNGQPFDFRGICYVYDSPLYGLEVRPEQVAIDLQLWRELGVNAIRCHYPFPQHFLAACDRAGIVVWLEPPVYCIDPRMESARAAFTDPAWRNLALTMLEELVTAARLHPSVAIYSIGNECRVEAPGAMDFFTALAERARKLDGTRLISYACLYGLAGDIAQIVDVVGFNEYWGWYDLLFRTVGVEEGELPSGAAFDDDKEWDHYHVAADRQLAATVRTIDLSALQRLLAEQIAPSGKPVFLTEFGADSIPNYRSGTLELWSEDYHAQLLRETLALAADSGVVCGTFPFAYSDYRDPSKEVNGYWDELNYKGVVTYARRRKAAFYAVKEAYARRAADGHPAGSAQKQPPSA